MAQTDSNPFADAPLVPLSCTRASQPDYIEKLHLLPEHMRFGMRAWIEDGQDSYPGSFLTAVLSNDLMAALGRADQENLHALPAYGVYLYNYAPSGCFGSKAKFEAWQGIGAPAEQAA